ncbi:MAG: hypothetical protein ABR903_07285 [Thermodesulfovibrionales bacterium]|jgi:hypothetical protein
MEAKENKAKYKEGFHPEILDAARDLFRRQTDMVRVFPSLLIFLVIFFFSSAPALAANVELCDSCHGQTGMSAFVDKTVLESSVHGKLECVSCHLEISDYPHKKGTRVNCTYCHFPGKLGAPTASAKAYELSVHGNAVKKGNTAAPSCQTCHGDHDVFKSTDERSKTTRQKIPSLCAKCHSREYDEYERSVHGQKFIEKKNLGAATCFDCHMEHLTPPIEQDRWKLALIRQCGTCHPREMKTYRKTYHGKVTRLGYAAAAKCSDCHGSHSILPKNDSGSTLSPQYLLYTCRACHPKATDRFTKFYAHADEKNRAKYPLLYYVYVFMTILLIGVFTFFILHSSLWAYRSLRERMKKKQEAQ